MRRARGNDAGGQLILELLNTWFQQASLLTWEQLKVKLGTRHMLTLTCGVNLASDLAAQHRYQEAYDLDAEVLELCQALIGRNHPSTLACSLNLSFDLRDLDREAEGATLFDQTMANYSQVLGAEHPAIRAAHASQRAKCDVDLMQFWCP